MFQSFLYSNGGYIIIDSDFQETVDYNKSLIEHIIKVYSKRNLNVALNIVLFMQYRNKEHGDAYYLTIDNQISWYKSYGRYRKDFDKYLPEIKKYLSLL